MNIRRYWLWLLVTVSLFASSGLAERLPLQKKAVNFDLKIPEHYEKWEGPPDPRTGIAREHDPQPRVIPLGKNPGRYAFEWIALDGTKKRAIYERPDGTDAIVAARVSELQDGYRYTYQIEVLPSSGVRLRAFMVQCFSDQVTPTEQKGIFVGKMWNGIPQFREGTWKRFAIRQKFVPNGSPGETVTLSLSSVSPPGLVECRGDRHECRLESCPSTCRTSFIL